MPDLGKPLSGPPSSGILIACLWSVNPLDLELLGDIGSEKFSICGGWGAQNEIRSLDIEVYLRKENVF